MSQISKQLDYKKEVSIHPTYRLNKILPLSGQSTQTISTAGGQETIFELPVMAMNFAESFITFQFRVQALAARYNNIFKDCFPHFRQIQLYTRSGIYMCDLGDLQNYTKITFNCETPLKEFLDIDFMRGVVGGTDGPPPTFPGDPANPGAIGSGYHFHRSGCVKDSYTGDAARPGMGDVVFSSDVVVRALGAGPVVTRFSFHIPKRTGDVGTGLDVAAADIANWNVTAAAATPGASYYDYTEPSYVYRTADVNQPVTMNVQLPLKAIKNTIFALNKDIYFGEIILLRVVWGSSEKIAFTGSSATNLFTNAAALATNIGVQNIALYLAVEKNQEIVNQLRSQIASGGFSMLIPYVYNNKNPLSGTSQNVSLRFNTGHGRRLLKIYHSIFHGTENSQTAYDHNNINGAKCISYYTMLNNERLQEYNVDCQQLDDYNLHRNFLKDKVLQTANIYQYNWFHREQFVGDETDLDNLETGLDLSIEQKWDIYCTTVTGQYNHYTYAITQKMLTISPAGITVG